MKTKSMHAWLLAFAALTTFSCRKEKILSPNARMLTQQAWLYDQFGIDEDLDGAIDIPTPLEACAMDDLVTFHADGNGAFDQGSDICYPGFPPTQSFNWQFYNNETQLEYGGEMHTILVLDETQLSIYTDEDNGGTPIRHILQYKH